MAKLLCECGWLMCTPGDANGVEFSLLYDVDEFYMDEGLEDFYANLPKDAMTPWRVAKYYRTPLHMWRCKQCQRLYIFNAKEEHRLSDLYYPQEAIWGEGIVADFQSVLAKAPWKVNSEKGTQFCILGTSGHPNLEPFELVGQTHLTRFFYVEEEQTELWVTALPDGGILSFSEGGWVDHYLYDAKTFTHALARYSLPAEQIRQLRLWAWAKAKAYSADDLDVFFEREGVGKDAP